MKKGNFSRGFAKKAAMMKSSSTGSSSKRLTPEQIEAAKVAEVIIGIDPGKHTGFAVWSRKMQSLNLGMFDFWGLIKTLELMNNLYQRKMFVRIEDPNQNPAMHWNQHKAGSINNAANIAQKVGMNKRDAQLIMEFLEKNGIPFEAVKPTKTKLKADEFKKITGYQGKTNEHNRDAGMLCYKY